MTSALEGGGGSKNPSVKSDDLLTSCVEGPKSLVRFRPFDLDCTVEHSLCSLATRPVYSSPGAIQCLRVFFDFGEQARMRYFYKPWVFLV